MRVAVVGGGVVGLACAFALVEDAHSVVVVERATPGAGASSGNAGWVVPSIATPLAAPGMVREGLRHALDPRGALVIRPHSILPGCAEVGPGGHFFGAAHTLTRSRECFYRPLVSTTMGAERWAEEGRRDAAARALDLWDDILAGYAEPPLDPAVGEAIDAWVAARAAELGHSELPWRTEPPERQRRTVQVPRTHERRRSRRRPAAG